MTKLFVEVRQTQRRLGAPVLVPLEEVRKHTGFRSVYCYDEVVAQHIQDSRSTRDLRGVLVHSDTLFLDFDNVDNTYFRDFLIRQGIGFELYDSGNRSMHYHIPITPMAGITVPAAQKAWVKQHAPDADMSFYHPSGQYRLPRTYHAKTGKPKILVQSYSGQLLSIPEYRASNVPVAFRTEGGSRESLIMLLVTRKGEGGRRPHIFQLATCAAELGMDFEETLEHLRWWNSHRCDSPHEEAVLQQQAVGAYRYISRKMNNE